MYIEHISKGENKGIRYISTSWNKNLPMHVYFKIFQLIKRMNEIGSDTFQMSDFEIIKEKL